LREHLSRNLDKEIEPKTWSECIFPFFLVLSRPKKLYQHLGDKSGRMMGS